MERMPLINYEIYDVLTFIMTIFTVKARYLFLQMEWKLDRQLSQNESK